MKIFYFLVFTLTGAYANTQLTCPQYPPPNNGRMICDHLLGKYCTPSCNIGFVPNGPQAWAYVCNPVTKRWATYPESYPLPWPDCVSPKQLTWNEKSDLREETELNNQEKVNKAEKIEEDEKMFVKKVKNDKGDSSETLHDSIKIPVRAENEKKRKQSKQTYLTDATDNTNFVAHANDEFKKKKFVTDAAIAKSHVPQSSSSVENNESYEVVEKLTNNRTNERKVDMTKVTRIRDGNTKELDIEDLKITTTRNSVANSPADSKIIQLVPLNESIESKDLLAFHKDFSSNDKPSLKRTLLSDEKNQSETLGVSVQAALQNAQKPSENALNNNSDFVGKTSISSLNTTSQDTNNSIPEQGVHEKRKENEEPDIKGAKGSTQVKTVFVLKAQTLDSLNVEQELRNITDTLREIGQSIKTLPVITKVNNSETQNYDSEEKSKNTTLQSVKTHHDLDNTPHKLLFPAKKVTTLSKKAVKEPIVLKVLNNEEEQDKDGASNSIENLKNETAPDEPPLVPVFSNQDLNLLRHMVSTNNKRSEMRHSSSSLWSKMMSLTSTKDDHQLRKPKLASRKQLATEDLNLAKLIMSGINNKANYHFKEKPNPFLYSGKRLGIINQSKLKTDKGSARQYVWNGATFVPLSDNEPSTSYLHSNEGGGLSSSSRYRWNGATFVPNDLSEQFSQMSAPSIQTGNNPTILDTFSELAVPPTQTQTNFKKEESDVNRAPTILLNKDVQKVLDIWNGSPEILGEKLLQSDERKAPLQLESKTGDPINLYSLTLHSEKMLSPTQHPKIDTEPTQDPKNTETTQQLPKYPESTQQTTLKAEFLSKSIEINGQTYVPLIPTVQIDPENIEDDLLYWDGKHYVPIKYQKVTVPGTILYKLENDVYMPTYYNKGDLPDNPTQVNIPGSKFDTNSAIQIQNNAKPSRVYPERPPSLSEARDFNDRVVAGHPTKAPHTSTDKTSTSIYFYINDTTPQSTTLTTSTITKHKPYDVITATTTVLPMTETTLQFTKTTKTPYTTSNELKLDILKEYSKRLPPVNPAPDDPFREDVEDLGNIIKTDLGIRNEIESLSKLFEADSKDTPVTIPVTHEKTISDIRLLMPSLFGQEPEEHQTISNNKPEVSLAEKDLQMADQYLNKEEVEKKFPIPPAVVKGNEDETLKSEQLKELLENKERTALENLSNKEKYDLEKTLSSDIQKLQSTFEKDQSILLPSIKLEKTSDSPNTLSANDLNVGDIRDLLQITKLAEKSASKKHGLIRPSLSRAQARKVLEKEGVQQLLKYLILSGASPSTLSALQDKSLRRKTLLALKASRHAKDAANAKDYEELRKINEQWDKRYKGLQKTIDNKSKNPLPKFGRKKRSDKKRKKRENG